MADIDQIIAGGAGASSRADFSGLADLPEAFWKGRDRRFVQEGRDLFKGGIPLNPDGSIDYGAMRNALFRHGDVPQGIALDNLDLARQQLRFGQEQSQRIMGFEQGGAPSQPNAIVSPPSANRTASATVAPPLNRGGVQQPQSDATAAPARGTSILQVLDAQGIPNDQLATVGASIARQLGVSDPTQPIDINNPAVRNVIVPAIQFFKRAGVGNVVSDGQPQPPDQVVPQLANVPVPQPRPPGAPGVPGPQPVAAVGSSAAIQPVPVQTQTITQGQPGPGPVTNAVTGTAAPAVPSRIDQAIAFYAGILSNPMSPKQNVELAKARLESLQKNAELTQEQKNYAQDVTQGFRGTMAESIAKHAADKTYAEKNTESYIKKYDAIQTAGDRARTDLPQLELARKLTDDPNFYSGIGEQYNLLLKRALVALGGDPNDAAPQEAFRKIVSNSILDQIKGMAGTGAIRVAEIKIMEQAAANPSNTPQANRLLLELSSRLQRRSSDIADMAQSYNGGRLDSGFDRQVAAYDRKNPIISDREIPDFRKIINSGAKAQTAPAATAASANPYEAEMRRRGLLK